MLRHQMLELKSKICIEMTEILGQAQDFTVIAIESIWLVTAVDDVSH